jgi:hypothetical protein
MRAPKESSSSCPECGSGNATVTATVAVGRWERQFCECPDCDLAFAGTWYRMDDADPAARPRQTRSNALPQLAV